MIGAAVRARRDVEAVRAEPHHVHVARAAYRTQRGQVKDGLEQVRLSLAVLADDRDAGRREGEIEPREIAEVAQGERLQHDARVGDRHLAVNFAGRFSRKALIPSALSRVAESMPKYEASSAIASSSGISSPRSTASMQCATASGPWARIVVSSARAALSSSPAGTTRFTSPMRYASAASISSPVSRS